MIEHRIGGLKGDDIRLALEQLSREIHCDSESGNESEEDYIIIQKSQNSPRREDEEEIDDPAIVDPVNVEPQPSTSGVVTRHDISDSDSADVGKDTKDVIASEVLDDSDFIERTVRARKWTLRRRSREEGDEGTFSQPS